MRRRPESAAVSRSIPTSRSRRGWRFACDQNFRPYDLQPPGWRPDDLAETGQPARVAASSGRQHRHQDLGASGDLTAPFLEVASSGCQTSGRKPAAWSLASTAASILSVLTFAWAITRTRSGLAIDALHMRHHQTDDGHCVGGRFDHDLTLSSVLAKAIRDRSPQDV